MTVRQGLLVALLALAMINLLDVRGAVGEVGRRLTVTECREVVYQSVDYSRLRFNPRRRYIGKQSGNPCLP